MMMSSQLGELLFPVGGVEISSEPARVSAATTAIKVIDWCNINLMAGNHHFL